jgi:hypothetical protein
VLTREVYWMGIRRIGLQSGRLGFPATDRETIGCGLGAVAD